MICPYCDYSWAQKVEQPKECPRCKRYFLDNMAPANRIAQLRVREAIEKGDLVRLDNCEWCGKPFGDDERVHTHHADYLEPLQINWLCVKCHLDWHSKHGPGLNRDVRVPVTDVAQTLGSSGWAAGRPYKYPRCPKISPRHRFIGDICSKCGFSRTEYNRPRMPVNQ